MLSFSELGVVMKSLGQRPSGKTIQICERIYKYMTNIQICERIFNQIYDFFTSGRVQVRLWLKI